MNKEIIIDIQQYAESKKIQLEILIELDRVCRENNIKYALYFGTLLGAVRHKGFIPWDDDIDVVMTREEYDKFCKIQKSKLGESYFFQNYETDPNFFRSFGRLRKNDTLYVQRHYQHLDIHHGIFIDIFPLDSVRSTQRRERFRYQYIHRLRRLNIIKHFGVSKDSNLVKKLLQKVIDIILPQKQFNRYITKQITKRNQDDLEYLGHLTDMINIDNFDKYRVLKKDLYDLIELEFEGHYFYAPRNYDEILARLYGEYMQYPDPKDRVPHHQVVKIDY